MINQDIINKLSEKLKKEYDNYNNTHKIDYKTITDIANELIEYCGYQDTMEVNIAKIVESLGIEIVECELYKDTVIEIGIRPNILSDGISRKLYISTEETLYKQRYQMAVGLGLIVLNYNKMLYTNILSRIDFIDTDAEKIIADAFATALMIPLKVSIEKTVEYIKYRDNKDKIQIEDIYQFLSTNHRISLVYVIKGYNQIKLVLNQLINELNTEEKEKYIELLKF